MWIGSLLGCLLQLVLKQQCMVVGLGECEPRVVSPSNFNGVASANIARFDRCSRPSDWTTIRLR